MIPNSNTSGVEAVIFDVAGTVLDHGCQGPVAAVIELFRQNGIAVTLEEARRPMGAHKKDHLWAMLAEPEIAARWKAAHGHQPNSGDLDRLFEAFTPLQIEVLKEHCDVIPGVLEVMRELRARRIKVANTTGFDSSMMEGLKKSAVANGYCPDLWVTPDLVGKGRPAPWMIFFAAKQFDLYPMSHFVKVGDTPIDIAEAHAAGAWAVAVVEAGNEVGLSRQELDALPTDLRQVRVSAARARLAACGPHYIIDSVAELMPVIDQISARVARGERP